MAEEERCIGGMAILTASDAQRLSGGSDIMGDGPEVRACCIVFGSNEVAFVIETI